MAASAGVGRLFDFSLGSSSSGTVSRKFSMSDMVRS